MKPIASRAGNPPAGDKLYRVWFNSGHSKRKAGFVDISGTAKNSLSGGKPGGASFEDSLRKDPSAIGQPERALAPFSSSRATDLAAGLGAMSPSFRPLMTEEMFNMLGLADGVVEGMDRYEKKMNDRRSSD